MMMGGQNHRVKNMLAVVQSIASQTLRSSPDPAADFVPAFQERVQALARAHGILTKERWRGTDLCELAEAVLGSFVDGKHRLLFEGRRSGCCRTPRWPTRAG